MLGEPNFDSQERDSGDTLPELRPNEMETSVGEQLMQAIKNVDSKSKPLYSLKYCFHEIEAHEQEAEKAILMDTYDATAQKLWKEAIEHVDDSQLPYFASKEVVKKDAPLTDRLRRIITELEAFPFGDTKIKEELLEKAKRQLEVSSQ